MSLSDTCVYMYYTDFIETLSSSHFTLSNKVHDWQHILCISTATWPSWLPLLNLWFNSSSIKPSILIITKSKLHHNLLGINRTSHITWSHQSFQAFTTSSFQPLLLVKDAIFFEGDLKGLSTLYLAWVETNNTTYTAPPLIVCVPGSCRLRQLSAYSALTWAQVNHSMVGGCTNCKVWIGFSCPHFLRDRTIDSDSPIYCPQVIRDLLEYAPRGVAHVPVSDATIPSFAMLRVTLPLACNSVANVWCANGLLPVSSLSKASTNLQILCPTPFTPNKHCIRSLTSKEYARLLDLPVAFENRFHSAFGVVPSELSPFNTIIPLKLLLHGLWLSGILDLVDSPRELIASTSRGGVISSSFDSDVRVDSVSSSVSGSNDQVSSFMVPQSRFDNQSDQTNIIDIKAAKIDSAAVPVSLWDQKLCDDLEIGAVTTHISSALEILRAFMIRIWRKRVLKSFLNYLSHIHANDWLSFLQGKRDIDNDEFFRDLIAGRDCLNYSSKASWWEWKGGSRLLFWRWSPSFKAYARDGIPICWINNQRPTSKELQRPVKDKSAKDLMKDKLQNVRNKGYIQAGKVKSLIKYFSVPKGDSDIRMVYDGTASGFNSMVWVPNFGLPTINTLLRSTSPSTWMVDLDIGEQFLNFMLEEEASQYVGVDLTQVFDEELVGTAKRVIWERYSRCAMGLKSSPNHAVRLTLVAVEHLTGLPWNFSNPFEYELVELNLPGMIDYLPGKPWFTVKARDGSMASALAIYVDDERIHASSCSKAHQCARQVASRESYLGIQDAARKRRPPSQQAGAWAGSIVRTNNIEVGILVSEDRWLKTKFIISKWYTALQDFPHQPLDTKSLLSDRGFLVYITRTYDVLTPYLKGIHLTLDGWRPDRDEEGWKQAITHLEQKDSEAYNHYQVKNAHNYPSQVKPVPRLIHDMEALHTLTASDSAPVLLIHTSKVFVAKYVFGDASGAGFGTSWYDGDNLTTEFGTWTERGSSQSSNFREFSNFVIKLEKEAQLGRLTGSELFLFTDNATTEAAFHNGTSSSPTLFDLILRVRVVQLNYAVRLHIIHVSGSRMIEQGTDGLSRGNLFEGVMTGQDMMSYIPIHLSAHERETNLLPWIRKWTNIPSLDVLTPRDWLWRGQGLSDYSETNIDGVNMPQDSNEQVLLWMPPPCIADIAVEYLRKSYLKRPHITHIFVVPKLMAYKWRKFLLKVANFSFYVDAGNGSHWPKPQHESLFICVTLPQLHCSPWSFHRTPKILAMERQLRQVQKTKKGSECHLLRKFWTLFRRIQSMPDDMVSRVLSGRQV